MPGRSDPQSALRLSLTDPPYATKTAAVKEASFEARSSALATRFALLPRHRSHLAVRADKVVGKALVAIKEADIEAAVSALSLDECDVLMKYLYRGFGMEGREKLYPALLKARRQRGVRRPRPPYCDDTTSPPFLPPSVASGRLAARWTGIHRARHLRGPARAVERAQGQLRLSVRMLGLRVCLRTLYLRAKSIFSEESRLHRSLKSLSSAWTQKERKKGRDGRSDFHFFQ